MHDCVRIELTILAFHTVHILQVPSSYLPPPSWPLVRPPRDRTDRDRGPPITRSRARGTTLPSHSRETAGTRCRISQPGAGHLENQNLDMILLDMWVLWSCHYLLSTNYFGKSMKFKCFSKWETCLNNCESHYAPSKPWNSGDLQKLMLTNFIKTTVHV